MHCAWPIDAWDDAVDDDTKALTRQVLPMPASPVTNTTCRRPAQAFASRVPSSLSSSSRPTNCGRVGIDVAACRAGGEAASAAPSASTCAIMRKPLRRTVRMQPCSVPSSPSAWRSVLMRLERAASETMRFFHMRLNRNNLVVPPQLEGGGVDDAAVDPEKHGLEPIFHAPAGKGNTVVHRGGPHSARIQVFSS